MSLSESDDSEALGFPVSEIHRTHLRLVAMLLGQGARLSYGHDWRDDGIMESVFAYVERYRPAVGEYSPDPLITNYLPWPDKPRLSLRDRKRLLPTLQVKIVSLPLWLRTEMREANQDVLRGVALTYHRAKITQKTDARICMGGRLEGFQGRYAGVIEEALCSLYAKKPLYLMGLMGGAARVAIDALKGLPSAKKVLATVAPNRHFSNSWPRFSKTGLEFSDLGELSLWDTFAKHGIEELSKHNGLTVEENERLFNVQTVDEALEIMLAGMIKIRR